MKAGILTFQNANNLGAVLQAYALQEYLRNNRIDCEFINYNMNASRRMTKRERNISKLKDKFLFLKDSKKYKKQKKFDKFRKKYLIVNQREYYNDIDFYKKEVNYDMLIVGSDQVWNSKITNNSKVFYFDFTQRAIKISYAASFGHAILEKEEIENVKNYLDDFEAISVREKQVLNQLQNYTKKKVQNVVDPVFLLDEQQWMKIMAKYKLPKKYIFIYLMENVNNINELIESVNKNKEYQILYIRKQ